MERGRFGRGHWRQAWGPWQGRRARRGDIKYLILEVLAEAPRHGYEIMSALEERSGGRYRPSAGSVYPTLQMLEDGGFITGDDAGGKRVYTITDAGRQMLTERGAETRGTDDEEDGVDLRTAAFTLGAAVMQAARVADAPAQAKVREILERARREIYAILAESE